MSGHARLLTLHRRDGTAVRTVPAVDLARHLTPTPKEPT
ncbi:hypothetical protein FsymDg_4359 [Candidatus Protofrankia datiscae]|uniref:Uncharacterized protein n=1 Tax=Candidatus Protofrankia datiscae TaxID=2716812 RepID=F8B1U8_9ACTN|nr:hypothetical protein FsymDg_0123 [Candidatus Protofrankia datiscae]AEH11612.1 hypothetical protein FsymDg_4359 [Candidatus Protofrankia datiscae]